MKLYPLMANLEARQVLIVGGGTVATRKIRALIETGARVRVVSPEFTREIAFLVSEKKILVEKRAFLADDLQGCTLVFAATNAPDLNDFISDEAAKRGIPVNNVTNPERGTFFVPSQVARGGLILAISTSGKSPATAKWMRKMLEKQIGPEYERLIEWMGILRNMLEQEGLSSRQVGEITEYLLDHDILEKLKANNPPGVLAILEKAFQSILKVPVPESLASKLGAG